MTYAAAKIEVAAVSRLFRALGDDTRLRIVALLSQGELCVCHLEAALALTQTNASRQLGILRAAGVVAARREERWVYYRLADQADPDRRRHLKALVGSFAPRELLKKDAARLRRSKGPGACR